MAAPANFIAVQGIGMISADQLNTLMQWTLNVASLRGFSGAVSNQVCYILGYVAPNDGGQGHYYWSPSSVAVDNGTTVVVPSGDTLGGWLRLG
jgi:hypothetical protein